MNAYSPPLPTRGVGGPLARWLRLPGYRRAAIMRAVAAGEMTRREICAAFSCSPALVQVARALTRVPSEPPMGYP